MANKVLTIPVESGFPSVDVWVNGKKYSYPTGQEVSVPEEVAAILQAKYSALPEAPSSGDRELEKVTTEFKAYVDYTYLPKYRTGASYILHFGGFSKSSTEYQIAHLSEVINPSVAYFVAKDGKETYIQPELITEELKTKYHVSSGMGNDARYYIPITDELIVLEYYISSTEAYYYLHTSADSIGTVEEVYVGKAQKLIDDSYASYYNLWSAQKTKESIDALRQSTNPNTSATAGHIGQLCLVGSSDFSPFDVYICIYSNTANNQYLWHKVCTTEAPQ